MIRSGVSPRADDGSLSPTPHEPADRELSPSLINPPPPKKTHGQKNVYARRSEQT